MAVNGDENLNPTIRALEHCVRTGHVHGVVQGTLVAPGITEENLKDIQEKYTCRDDDLFVATPAKCGTTWIQQIVKLIQNNGVDNGVDSDIVIPWFELMSPEEIKAMPSPRIFKTHLAPHLFPPKGDPKSSPAKFISSYRNPKDYMVSFYFHLRSMMQGKPFPFDKYMEEAIAHGGDTMDNIIKYWWLARDSPNVLLMCYESMKRDLPSAVAQIATFMGYNLAGETIVKITEEATFDKMKSNPLASKRFTFDATFNKDGNNTFLRKGEVGDWKNYLSEEQSAKIDALVEKHFAGTGLVFQYV